MPRRSQSDLMTVRPATKAARIKCRSEAPGDVRELFGEIVMSCPADHFRASDGHLLEAFCQATLLCRAAFRSLRDGGPIVDGKPSPWLSVLEKMHRSATQLAGKLRLAPIARLDSKTAARRREDRLSFYEVAEYER